jgi:hypothetical protein
VPPLVEHDSNTSNRLCNGNDVEGTLLDKFITKFARGNSCNIEAEQLVSWLLYETLR